MPYPLSWIALAAIATFSLTTIFAGAVAQQGFPLPQAERRYGCVDGLRGFLATSVMIHHFVIWLQVARLGGAWAAPEIHALNNLGAGAVALFFMVTGFVFHPRILAGFGGASFSKVLLGRVFRIVPLVVVSIAVILAIIAHRGGRQLDWGLPQAVALWVTGWKEVPLLGKPDSGRLNAYVLWSIWYEWVFYILILPLCMVMRDVTRNRLPSFAVPLTLLVAAYALTSVVDIRLLDYLPLFAIGMLAFEVHQSPQLRARLTGRWIALAATAALMAAVLFGSNPYGAPDCLLYGFFLTVVACGNDLGSLLRSRGARLLGECSFGIYLLHGIVLSLIFVEGAPVIAHVPTDKLPLLLLPAGLVVAGGAALAHLLVEKPGIRLGRRIADGIAVAWDKRQRPMGQRPGARASTPMPASAATTDPAKTPSLTASS